MKLQKVLPPIWFLLSIILMIGLDLFLPIKQLLFPPITYLGIVAIAIGIGIVLFCDYLFRQKNTIPWNIYFDARETLIEAQVSQEKGIKTEQKQLNYVQKIARWSIIGAVALHVISALALYLLAATGISNVGYVSSGLTLLLTILRPAIRGYQYLTTRLSTIKKEIKYPREDAIELRNRVKTLETAIKKIQALLDTTNPDSLISKQQQISLENSSQLARQKALLEEYKAKNSVEHQQLSREAKNAIAQLDEDSQFLGHVREIIRFIKTA